MKLKTGKADPDHSPTTKCIAGQIITIHIEATPDHNTGIDTTTTEAAHDDLVQPTEDTVTDLTVTPCTSHMADHPHIAALWVINPEIVIGHTHNHPNNLQGMNHADLIHTPAG